MEYARTFTLKDGRTCVVRNGTEQDAPAVLANYVATHGQTDFLGAYPDEITLTLEQEKAYLERKRESSSDAALVAEIGGAVVGTAGIDRLSAAEKARHRASFGISIDRDWWGIGVGRALTEACIECARVAGYVQMELEVVADNERALRLYRSAGFVEYGRNPRGFRTRQGLWQENVLMRLELGGGAEERPDHAG